MPQLGETVTEGTITKWFKSVGEAVALDEVLFEVSTDKVDTEVPSPLAGTLSEIKVPEGETVEVGTVLAVLGDGGDAPAAPAVEEPAPEPEPEPTPPPAPPAPPATPAPEPVAEAEIVEESAPGASSATEGKLLSPVVRRMIKEHGLDASAITGTGLGGRISRDDVQRHISSGGASAPAPASSAAPAAAATPTRAVAPAVTATDRDTVIPLTNIRLKTGEHMVMSKAVAPHTLTAMEIDYENVETVRRKHGAEFKSNEGFSLTYLPFISRACIDALGEFPHLNASVGQGELVVHNYINLAVAVDLNFEGLLAPVVHGADGQRMRAIARSISDVARRARSKQLAPDELSGGTFTLTNAGSYGTMMQFPIINQPQVAIMSTDAVKRKPVVVTDDFGNESIAIHSVGVLALAWDHRAIDGAYAAAFMARVKEIIETRDWESELG